LRLRAFARGNLFRRSIVDKSLIKPGFELWPLIELSSDGIVLVATNPWRGLAVNSTLAAWLATTPERLVGQALGNLFDEGSLDFLYEKLAQITAGESSDEFFEMRLASSRGMSRPVAARFSRVGDEGAKLVGIVLQDRTADLSAPRLDPLTNLPDRTFLNARLIELLGSRHPAESFAILFVDINNFKEINDRHGHVVGDRVLRDAARQLSGCLDAGSWPVRYGGDEFVVLVQEQATTERVESLVAAIKAAMSRPIAVPDGVVSLAVSVGMAMGPAEFRTSDDVIETANRAMYAAKRRS
jgi:diguanylate cyclase (GGDEF)-like protein